ncbi:hypothetical protein GCM10011581_40640 [Saccharopolyspora subtropica]|uniref:Signal transduction histidine kinase n=1 Tax=Saccharopolyspora thermophila TaxID=89367 RepID=A0A917K333_9PSEU|nr:hypothetical protein [Saccharopolyspora subtropica]GGI99314.1 hypothetical protein GCM10011581_40640 [Saccharopolyspora subtropica]
MHGNWAIGPLRRVLLAGLAAVVFAVVAGAVALVFRSGQAVVLSAFVAAAVCVAGAAAADRWIERLLPEPQSGFAAVAGKLPAVGSWEQSLPVLARMLAEATDAEHASVWLAAGGRLVTGTAWPAPLSGTAHTVADIDALRAVPGIGHVVPIEDGDLQRGALAITKQSAVTEADERRMRDIANGTALLLRSVALANELRARVRRAEELSAELTASEQRMRHARDTERRRVVGEITTVTEDGLGAISAQLEDLKAALGGDPDSAGAALTRMRATLEGVIERFRAVVHGVYPGVLRDEGPLGALREFCADLGKPVQVTGALTGRVDWEIESAVYYLAASAIRLLSAVGEPVEVRLLHDSGRITARVAGPPPRPALDLRAALSDDEDRIAALGGELRCEQDGDRVAVVGWLPDHLAPLVEEAPPPAAVVDEDSVPGRINRLARRCGEVSGREPIPPVRDACGARKALAELEEAVRALPLDLPARAELVFELDRIRADDHELTELELIELLRGSNVALPEAARASAARLLGATGRDPCTRLALPFGSAPEEIRSAAARELHHWRDRAENPLAPRQVREVGRGVVRTCEGLLHVTAG